MKEIKNEEVENVSIQKEKNFIIKKNQVLVLMKLFYELFSIEDENFVDYRKKSGKERAIKNRIKKVTNDLEMQNKIYSAFDNNLFTTMDIIISHLEKIGVGVIE